MIRRLAPVAALALAVSLAACGGGGGESGIKEVETLSSDDLPAPVVRPLTKDRYIREGDRICAAAEKKLEDGLREAVAGVKSAPTPAEVGRVMQNHVTSSLELQLERLRALPAPKGDERELKRLWDSLEAAVAKLSGLEPERFMVEATAVLEEPSRRAEAYGFETCGGTGSTPVESGDPGSEAPAEQ